MESSISLFFFYPTHSLLTLSAKNRKKAKQKVWLIRNGHALSTHLTVHILMTGIQRPLMFSPRMCASLQGPLKY